MIKVLIIDDSALSLRTHVELAEEAGLKVVSAKGGEEGVSVYEEEMPDFVLSDVMMPDMDGYEVLEILQEINPEVVLYFVSAEKNEKIVQKIKAEGARGIVEKPLTLENLKKIMEEL